MNLRRSALMSCALLAMLPLAQLASAQTAILGSTSANAAYVFPNVTFAGSCPATLPSSNVTGISGTPHGVGYYGSDFALISNFSGSQVWNVQISTHTVLNTISTGAAGYSGIGSIAVAPNLQFALMSGGSSSLVVMHAPFSAPTFTNVPLPGSISSFQTEAIVFDAASRAYVGNSGGITVLDPPYTSVAFTIPIGAVQGLAITPDGNTLLATSLGNTVRIVTGPFSAASTAVTLPIPGSSQLDGIVASPDGQHVLVVDASGVSSIFSISAPYSASSTVQAIPIPAGTGSLEDISISADNNFALATGNTSGPMLLIKAPFTTAGAVSCAIPVTGGRGAGAVRFLPVNLQPPVGGPPPPTLPVPTLSEWALAALGLLLSLTAFGALRRRMR
ncbi:MAG TPA: IPTL-CTERM sorting domain-containing protein [Casimicrobiaceae bacterium]|nr:IPTL-CTERM sorting domain-containing protein [Casimicrobiaceae bacterium]